RSSVRPTGSPPIPIHTRARARRPAGPPAPAPPPSTVLLLPWLQFLKGWSLRQTRGDSGRVNRTVSPNVGGKTLSPGPPAGCSRVRERIAAAPPATASNRTSYVSDGWDILPP